MKGHLHKPVCAIILVALLSLTGIIHAAGVWRLVGITGAQTDDTQTTQGVYDHPDHTLYEIDYSNGAIAPLFQLPWVNDSQAMGYCPTNGLVYHTGGSEAYSNNPLRNGHDQGGPDVAGVGYQDSQYMESVNLTTHQTTPIFNADPCPNPDSTLPCFGLPAPIPSWQLPAYRRDSTMTDGTNRVTGPNEYHAARGLAWSTQKNCFFISDELGIFKLTAGGDCTKLTNRPGFVIPTDNGPVTNYNDAKAIAFVTVSNQTRLWVGSRMDNQPSGNTNGWIMEIDPETGNNIGQLALKYPPGGADAGGPLPDDFGGLLGLAQHPVSGMIYGIRKTSDPFARELITINPQTGDTTLVGSLGMHVTSFAFVLPTVSSPLQVQSAVRNGSNLTITWTGGNPPYQVQRRTTFSGGGWANEGATTSSTSASVPISGSEGYFRIQGQ